jgi:hypothetical protein
MNAVLSVEQESLVHRLPGDNTSDKLRRLMEPDLAKPGAHPGPFPAPAVGGHRASVDVPREWLAAVARRCGSTDFGRYIRALLTARVHPRVPTPSSAAQPGGALATAETARPTTATTPEDMLALLTGLLQDRLGPYYFKSLAIWLYPTLSPEDRDYYLEQARLAYGIDFPRPLTASTMIAAQLPLRARPTRAILGAHRGADSVVWLDDPRISLGHTLSAFVARIGEKAGQHANAPVDIHLALMRWDSATYAIYAYCALRPAGELVLAFAG